MKRNLLIVLALLVALACASLFRGRGVTVYAQSLPITKTVAWDQTDEATAGVLNWTVRLDGTIVGSPTVKEQAITLATVGAHTVTVTATNLWGVSSPATLTFTVVLAAAPGNVRIQ
ncbi:MAG: hypothetical protein NUW22_12395 [Acidobacteria bacterium]|nr:hypothetical protein [Acidobacteriota bacterium]